MDVHRIVIGDQYYLQISFGRYPICCVMNEQMILVNQLMAPLVESGDVVLCVNQQGERELWRLPLIAISEAAKQRGVAVGMEAKEALLLLQKEED